MKIALDTNIFKALDTIEMVYLIADWGYQYIKQSPHIKINPYYRYPKASRELLDKYKKALKKTNIAISSFSACYRWSGPTEDERQIAVQNWKRLIVIACEMEVNVITSELLGMNTNSEQCEAMWYKSMHELIPILEQNNIRIDIMTHPHAFCDTHESTLDLIKSLHSDNVGYLFRPESYYESVHCYDLLKYANNDLSHIELPYADHPHYISNKYIQQERINFDEFFNLLKKINFPHKNKKVNGDSIITVSISDYSNPIDIQAIKIREDIEQKILNTQTFLLEKIAKNHHI